MVRENRDSFGEGRREAEIENEEEGEKGERMGRDGKLTRSLLPGALGAENKERRRDR